MTGDEISAALLAAAQAMSPAEVVAVVLGIAYLVLAVRESLWCWPAALVSTGLFLLIFWRVGLLMESALQVYYLSMAVYGWWHWRHGGKHSDTLAISRWPLQRHAVVIGAVLLMAVASGLLLSRWTDAALPFLDSFTTWGSVVTTWMVARKILENWLYWLVIDSVSIYLYLDRGLLLTAALFCVYLVIVVLGFRQWLQSYRNQPA